MTRFHPLIVKDVRRETADAVSIALDVPERLKAGFVFRPGQYLTLRATIDGEDIRRSYSICSGVDENELRIGVKKVAGGAFSTFANERLKIGDRIEVMPPEGRFVCDPSGTGRHILGVAAGSGITPILSIARSVLSTEPEARVTLVYGNQTSRSVMFAEAIEDLKNRYLGRLSVVHVLSREPQDVAVLAGRITGERLRELSNGVIDLSRIDQAFLCGPQGMVDDVMEALGALGLRPDQIRHELFTPAAPRARHRAPIVSDKATTTARVTVTLDGKTTAFDWQNDDDNLVDAAARAGLELPYSCHGGMCCTCRCRVVEGEADMAVNYSLEEWELKAGFTLACQARPKGRSLTVDFDEL